MKILVIADLHGLNIWNKFIQQDYEKIVFLWDYVDSFDISNIDILHNLHHILNFKRKNPEKVVLLLWNHDVQYFMEWCDCSWKRSSISGMLSLMYNWALKEKLFKICHQEWDYLFSHAGFTKNWEMENMDVIDNYFPEWFYEYEQLNDIFFNTHDSKIFTQCWPERGGFDKYSWPLWAGKQETMECWVEDVVQVVWHTPIKSIERYNNIIYCDTLEGWDKKPLILEI